MTRYKPPSIRDKTLKVHLNETKEVHNGLGYDEWRHLRDSSDEFGRKYKKADIIRAFGISWRTFWYWEEVDKEEQDEKNSR